MSRKIENLSLDLSIMINDEVGSYNSNGKRMSAAQRLQNIHIARFNVFQSLYIKCVDFNSKETDLNKFIETFPIYSNKETLTLSTIPNYVKHILRMYASSKIFMPVHTLLNLESCYNSASMYYSNTDNPKFEFFNGVVYTINVTTPSTAVCLIVRQPIPFSISDMQNNSNLDIFEDYTLYTMILEEAFKICNLKLQYY